MGPKEDIRQSRVKMGWKKIEYGQMTGMSGNFASGEEERAPGFAGSGSLPKRYPIVQIRRAAWTASIRAISSSCRYFFLTSIQYASMLGMFSLLVAG